MRAVSSTGLSYPPTSPAEGFPIQRVLKLPSRWDGYAAASSLPLAEIHNHQVFRTKELLDDPFAQQQEVVGQAKGEYEG